MKSLPLSWKELRCDNDCKDNRDNYNSDAEDDYNDDEDDYDCCFD